MPGYRIVKLGLNEVSVWIVRALSMVPEILNLKLNLKPGTLNHKPYLRMRASLSSALPCDSPYGQAGKLDSAPKGAQSLGLQVQDGSGL